MELFYTLDEFAKTGYHTSAALGFFDGVHLGHRTVIGNAVQNKGGLHSVVLTFSEPPAKALTGAVSPVLTTNEEKQLILEAMGVDAVVFADFSALRDMSPRDFVRIVLKEKLHAKKVFCGFNYHFGSKGAGGTGDLLRLCAQQGIAAQVSEPVCCDGEIVSSTRIRRCLKEGRINEASKMLCRPYTLFGEVCAGNHIGTALGFPTLNFPIDLSCIVPRYGVYASEILVDTKVYRGATNIGVHPTFKETPTPLCETFLLDFEGDELYDKKVRCRLLRFIRPEKKFSSLEELQAQIEEDIKTIRRVE